MKLRPLFYRLPIILILLISAAANAQDEPGLFPPGKNLYDSEIPSPYHVFGHKFGERHTFQWEMERFIHEVEKRSDRVAVKSYGKTYQGRNLYTVIISSPENMKRLEDIRAANLQLTDPRITSPDDAEQIAEWMPSIVWIGYNIHGNEASAMEAAVRTIYQLAAGTDDVTAKILDNVVTIIDPVQNPDGHDRYVQYQRSITTLRSHPEVDDIEHARPWPGGRTNHYLFDLNRDFFLKTQIESWQRSIEYHKWMPHVFPDVHEMGSNATYFFAPPMDPYNEWQTEFHFKWWDIIARANAEAFDRFGWGYYTKESFDGFYPGYGGSYPGLNGAISMTYEQASARGVSTTRDDGYVLTLREASWHHFTSSMATLVTISERRKEKVLDFYRFFETALEEARTEKIKEIILLPDRDPHIASKLIENLLLERIEIERAVEPFTNSKSTCYVSKKTKREQFPEGTLIIRLNQPNKRLIKLLLAPEIPMTPEFLEEERVRQENRESSHFYDVSAWSMPLTYGVRARWTGEKSDVRTEPVTSAPVLNGEFIGGPAKQAYLIPNDNIAVSKVLAKLLSEDYKVRMATKEFTVENITWPKGTLVCRVNRNPVSLHSRLSKLSSEYGIKIFSVNTGLASKGNDLGSNTIVSLRKPKIAIVTDSPARSYSYGAMHYLFEREMDLDFTRISYEKLAGLDDYNVVVLPAGNYSEALSEEQLKSFKSWISNGGTVVAVSGSTDWLRSSEISKTKLLNGEKDPETGETIKPWRTTGAIVKVNISPFSFMSYGINSSVNGFIRSSSIFQAFDDKFKDAGLFAPGDEMKLSGWIWPESEKYLPGSGYLFVEPVGAGKLILFTEDPNFRASYDGLNKLFFNGILLGPSFRR